MKEYRSKYEQQLVAALEAAGIPFLYEDQDLTYYTTVRGGLCAECGAKRVLKKRTYTVDFSFPNSNIVLEGKGHLDSSERTKFIAIKEEHPELDIRFAFMRDNKLSRQSATRYTEWATKHGFKCFVGTAIPKSWIKEMRRGRGNSNPS